MYNDSLLLTIFALGCSLAGGGLRLRHPEAWVGSFAKWPSLLTPIISAAVAFFYIIVFTCSGSLHHTYVSTFRELSWKIFWLTSILTIFVFFLLGLVYLVLLLLSLLRLFSKGSEKTAAYSYALTLVSLGLLWFVSYSFVASI